MMHDQCEKAELHSLERAFRKALTSETGEVFRVNTCRGLLDMKNILIEGGKLAVLVTVVGDEGKNNG